MKTLTILIVLLGGSKIYANDEFSKAFSKEIIDTEKEIKSYLINLTERITDDDSLEFTKEKKQKIRRYINAYKKIKENKK